MQAMALISLVLAIALALIARLRLRATQLDRPGVRLMHGIFIISLALMTLSSILMLAIGSSMHGWMLMLHMTIAPLFAISITTLSLMWAQRTSSLLRLVILASFVTILTAMFTMMTWFGSDWQRWLLDVHRLASMVLLVAAAAQAGRMLFAGGGDAARARD
jgi:hypothetical protein